MLGGVSALAPCGDEMTISSEKLQVKVRLLPTARADVEDGPVCEGCTAPPEGEAPPPNLCHFHGSLCPHAAVVCVPKLGVISLRLNSGPWPPVSLQQMVQCICNYVSCFCNPASKNTEIENWYCDRLPHVLLLLRA